MIGRREQGKSKVSIHHMLIRYIGGREQGKLKASSIHHMLIQYIVDGINTSHVDTIHWRERPRYVEGMYDVWCMEEETYA